MVLCKSCVLWVITAAVGTLALCEVLTPLSRDDA